MKYRRSVHWILTTIAVLILAGAQLSFGLSSDCTFRRDLRVNGTVNLQVATGSGSIEVTPGSDTQVEICGHVKASNWFGGDVSDKIREIAKNPPVLQSGNDIQIGRMNDPEWGRDVSISYEIVVPAATVLHSHTGSGNQEIRGIQGPAEVGAGSGGIKLVDIGGAVRAETGSGSIAFDHVKGNVRAHAGSGSIQGRGVAGGFEASTGSGYIDLEQTASGAVRVNTGSGGMELRGIHGSLEAQAGSGAIQAEGDPTGAWSVHTGSGGVHLQLASNAAFDLDARSRSGSVELNHPDAVQSNVSSKEIQAKIRGGGVPVSVETGSGSIEIQ